MLSLTVDVAWISHSVSQNLQISFNAEFHTKALPFFFLYLSPNFGSNLDITFILELPPEVKLDLAQEIYSYYTGKNSQ